MDEYDGRQFVGIDLHRQRSVIVRQSESGEQLSAVRIVNDPVALGLQLEQAGSDPEVVLEATYGWYWAVDVLQAVRSAGAFGASVGGQGIPLPAGEERRTRRRRSGRSAADGPTARGVDRSTGDPRIAGVGALPGQAGRDPIRTEGAGPCRTGQGRRIDRGVGSVRRHRPATAGEGATGRPPTPNESARCWNSSTSSTATKRASPR